MEYATKAGEVTKWSESVILGTLATAYAETGRFEKETRHYDSSPHAADAQGTDRTAPSARVRDDDARAAGLPRGATRDATRPEVPLGSRAHHDAHIRVFELKELLDELILGARIGELFGVASDYFLEQKRKKSKQAAVEVVEVRPRIFGVNFDVKKGIEFLKSLRQ